ncbi:DUF2142 domain-containing protein [Glaciihabitans sp. INWT7]|uniref:DUF2142 domain-containing protein n=1 Tax=Glaciihabitans sp. INWT7 TaxID=2596912 RepID=UPI0016240020|nr:DUF2142 domain-containing protein [Glaciihabitans sp. INWT7]QNE45997.1 DUF2142 domain-containing protein [Glaciihabitans sp. INWT7]
MPTSSLWTGRWGLLVCAFLLLLAPMLIWALASPLGSVPDEPSHAIRAAAVVRGEPVSQQWAEHPSLATARVPRYVAELRDRTCFAFHPRVSAACAVFAVDNPNEMVLTGTSAANNGPLYYAIVGTPTLFLSGDVALYGMRFVNAILCAALLAATFMQTSQFTRSRWTMAAVTLAVTPMMLFLGGSINPNGVEAASAGLLFVTLLGILRSPNTGRILWERAITVVLAVVLLVSTRSISLLWLIAVIAAALIFADRSVFRVLVRRPAAWIALGGSAVAAFSALVWFAHPPSLVEVPLAGAGTKPGTAFVSMLARSFDFSSSYIGIFGWQDTPSPSFTILVIGSAVLLLVLAALIWGTGRARWVALGFGGLLLLVPPVTQAIVAPHLGYIWQGRYMLAIFLCLLICCGVAIDESFDGRALLGRSRVALNVGVTLVGLGQIASLETALRRYMVGDHGAIQRMILNPEWQPPFGLAALTFAMLVWAAVAGNAVVRRLARVQSIP